MEKLFPEGIDEVKIWRNFVSLFRKKDDGLSIEELEDVANCSMKLKNLIGKIFPKVTDQLAIIALCDVDLLHGITQKTYSIARSHRVRSLDAIILHGRTPEQKLLDWATQSVITMLLRQIKATI